MAGNVRARGAIALVFCVLVVSVVLLSFLPEERVVTLVRENGLVEMLTVVMYAVVVFCLLILPLRTRNVRTFAASGVVSLLCLRELDFHTRFTTMGIFKTKFYVSPEVPLSEKTIVTVVVLMIVVAVLLFARRHWAFFIQGLRRGETPSLAVACGLGCAVLSKMLDSMADLFHPLCFWYNPTIMLRAIEEVLEFGIPLFFLVAIYSFYKERLV